MFQWVCAIKNNTNVGQCFGKIFGGLCLSSSGGSCWRSPVVEVKGWGQGDIALVS